MDNIQRETIRQNLPTLLYHTRCSTDILCRLSSVLSTYDIQCIKSMKTKVDKANQLYEIITTKLQGHDKLLQALLETKQTKSAKILLNAAVLSAISKAAVTIGGRLTPLNAMFADDELRELSEKVSTKIAIQDLYDSYKDFLIVSEKIDLKNTIPAPPSYYIPRHIYANRKNLDANIFKTACQDVFVFKSNQMSELIPLLNHQTLYQSVTQVVRVTGRFILLNQDLDWPEIRTKAYAPVHLIKHEFIQGTHKYILEDTSAGSEIIHKYLRHSDEATSTIEEHEFIKTALQESSSGICICDKPGMGKSFLLANLARNVQKLYPERIVVYIQLPELAEKLPVSPFTPDALKSLRFVLEHLNDNAICQTIITSLPVIQKTALDIFLDGFDEIEPHKTNLTKTFLSQLRTLPNIKLYVTSRISTRSDLEESLGAMSYDILPFSDKNQQDFLTNFWCKQYPENDSERIVNYTKFCLKELKIKLNEAEREMAGTPLLCRLVANIYGEYARIYSQIGRNISDMMCSPSNTSLSQLYAEYIERQLGRTTCNFKCLFDLENATCSLQCKRKSLHAWIAIQTMSPDLHREMGTKLVPTLNVDKFVFSSGLLVRRFKESVEAVELEFVHRTFAEFLLAEILFIVLIKEPEICTFKSIRSKMRDYLGSLLTPSNECKDVLTILNEYTVDFQFQVLFPAYLGKEELFIDKPFLNEVFAHFLDWFLSHFEISSTFSGSSDFRRSIPEPLYVLLACIRLNYIGIFKLITKTVFTPSIRWFDSIRNFRTRRLRSFFIADDHKNALVYSLMAAKHSKMPLWIQILEFFQAYIRLDFSNIIADLPKDCATHLVVAIQASNFEMVSYFSKCFPLKGQSFLDYCLTCHSENVYRRYWLDENRLDSCKFFVHGGMVENIGTCLRHVDIIKGLILLGTDITKVVGYCEIPMYYFVCCFLSPEEYLELQKYVLETQQIDISIRDYRTLVVTVSWHSKSKLSKVKPEGILGLYQKPVSTERFLTDVFHELIRWDRSLKELKMLVEWGELYFTNLVHDRRQTALHIAVDCESDDVVEYLVSFGVPLDAQDEDGNTPLHLATQRKSLTMIELLIRKGCNMHLRNGQGCTFLQVAAKWEESTYVKVETLFIDMFVFLKDFVGEARFSEEGGIFTEALKALFGANLPESVKQLFGLKNC